MSTVTVAPPMFLVVIAARFIMIVSRCDDDRWRTCGGIHHSWRRAVNGRRAIFRSPVTDDHRRRRQRYSYADAEVHARVRGGNRSDENRCN